jgi:hypothetical protein
MDSPKFVTSDSNISKNFVCSFARAGDGSEGLLWVHTNFGKWFGISADSVLSYRDFTDYYDFTDVY